MPRQDWNTARSKNRNHKPMNSASKGKGHDAKVRRRKQELGSKRIICPVCHRSIKAQCFFCLQKSNPRSGVRAT